ncbi:DUF2804 domain-containing protein [bacterium]|nr:DUF2804 domain-containing protein [bacterium]
MRDTAPERLIDGHGRPAFGVYNAPIRDLNYADFDARGVGLPILRAIRAASSLSRKRWIYLGVTSPDVIVGAAIVDVGWLMKGFAYVYDRASRVMRESSVDDLRRRSTLAANPSFGESVFDLRELRIHTVSDGAGARLTVRLPEVEVDAALNLENQTPLCLVSQNGLRGFMYTHKHAGVPVAGTVRAGNERYALDGKNAFGVFDVSGGCPMHYTYWNWASASGRLADGRAVGINFVSGFGERGFTENAYWVGGIPHKTDTAFFDYDTRDLSAPWKITTSDGRVRLHFAPADRRAENFRFAFFASRFAQPFGMFTGEIDVDGSMTPVTLDGFVEEHEAWW